MTRRPIVVWLFALSLVGCTCHAPTPAGKVDWLSGHVVDVGGGRSDVRVRLVAVRSAPCPCVETPDDQAAFDACACAESLSTQRRRLAEGCASPVLAETRSSAKSAWRLPLLDGGTLLEASAEGLAQWLPLQGLKSELTLDLQPTIDAVVRVSAPEGTRDIAVTAFFEDGRCQPFTPEDGHFTAQGLPAESGWVLVDAPGMTPVQVALRAESSVELLPPRTLRGTCAPRDASSTVPYEVVWRSRYEQRRVLSNSSGDFAFENVLQTQARVTCSRRGKLVAATTVIPDAESDELVFFEDMSREDESPEDEPQACTRVELTDQHGQPVVEATIEVQPPEYATFTTDAKGHACVEGREVRVIAPAALGGACAGRIEIDWLEPGDDGVARVVLPLEPLKSTPAPFTGQVVDASGVPVAGASVTIDSIEPVNQGEPCQLPVPEAVETLADGTFETAPTWPGAAQLKVSHRWHRSLEQPVTLPSTRVVLKLGRASKWQGRFVAFDGRPIAGVAVTANIDSTYSTATTAADGSFTLQALQPGKVEFRARFGEGKCLGQVLRTTRTVADEVLVENVVWPGPGSVLTGRGSLPGCACAHAELVTKRGETKLTVGAPMDAQGRFSFEALPPGQWKVTDCADQHATADVPHEGELLLRHR